MQCAKILITGGTGRLGRELVKDYLGSLAPTHSELDLCDREAVFEYITMSRPDLIIHTAAIADVKKCEEEKQFAWNSNVAGTENLVDACLEHIPGVYFVYISTACVFEGNRGLYKEVDLPYPKNFYGVTKLVGEYIVRRIPKFLIIRTNFVAKEKWPYPRAFTDRFGTYLFTGDVAKGIKEVIAENMERVIHIVGDRKMSMYELAKLTTTEVEPISLTEFDGPPLTVDMSLDTVIWKKYRLGEST